MTGLLRREPSTAAPTDVFERLDRTLGEWMEAFPLRRPVTFTREWLPADLVQVDEFYEDGTLVIRADLPGIDPDRDVEITVADGMLHIQAERRQEESTEERGYVRRELRYGSFARSLAVPEGITEEEISARYRDGILEIRIPAPEPTPVKRVSVSKE